MTNDINKEQSNGAEIRTGIQGDTTTNGRIAQANSARKESTQVAIQSEEEPSEEIKEMSIEQYLPAAIKAGLIAFNAYRIKRECPLAYTKLKEYMVEKSQDGIIIDDETVAGILLYTPRTVLFDFLDENQLYMNIGIHDTVNKKWSYNIPGGYTADPRDFSSRAEAEFNAVTRAFVFLEKNLQNKA